MRYGRVFVGFVLIVAAIWVVISEQLAGASADATVNAQIVSVRTPIAGYVALRPYALGAAVTKDVPLGAVNAATIDNGRYRDLVMQQSDQQATIDRLETSLAALKSEERQLRTRLAAYHADRIQELTTRLGFAQDRLARLEGRSAAGADPAARPGAAQPKPAAPASGVVSGASPGAIVAPPGLSLVAESHNATIFNSGPQLPGFTLSYAREQVASLKVALQAAQRGIYLGDGYNDTPFSGQRLQQVEAEIAATQADLSAAQNHLRALSERADAERVKTLAASSIELTAPVNGLYWEPESSDGEYVERGDTLIKLADCDSAVVTLSVSQGVYNRLHIGSAAKFRFTNDAQIYDASVLRLGGSGAATLYHNLAVAPGPQHLERYDVAVLVPALRNDPKLRCLIGRTGLVYFDRRPLDWLRRMVD